MKTTNRTWAAVLAGCLLVGADLQAAGVEWSPPAAQDLLPRLRPRPRLLVTAGDMVRLRQHAEHDSDLSEAFTLMRQEDVERGRIAVRLVPLESGQPPLPPTLMPLEKW